MDKGMRITDSKDDLRNSSNGSLPPDTDGGIGWLILERALRYADDIGGVALIAAAILTILGISGGTHGGLIDPWATFLKRWFGTVESVKNGGIERYFPDGEKKGLQLAEDIQKI